MPRTTSAYDIGLSLPSIPPGAPPVELGLMLVKSPSTWENGDPLVASDVLASLSADSPVSQDLVGKVEEDWSAGLGLAYSSADCVETEIPGYALPAGAAFPIDITTTVSFHPSASPIVAFAEFKGDVFAAQEGDATTPGRVLRLTGDMGAITELTNIGATATPLLFGARYVRDLIVADNGSGQRCLYISASDANHLNGVMYEYDGTSPTGNWRHSGTAPGTGATFGGLGRNRMGVVYWKTSDGNGGTRLLCISGEETLSYTVPNGDPLLDASWVDVKVGTFKSLREIVAFRRHAFLAGDDGLWDVNELGEAEEITSYLRRMLDSSSHVPYGTGYAVEHLDGYIYMGVGRGLIRTFVGTTSLDERPQAGECHPGYNTASLTEGVGYTTALCVDQGRIVDAVYNPGLNRSYIFWGQDRTVANIPNVPQPMVWHGPKVVILDGYRVTRMVTSGAGTTTIDGTPRPDLRLWVASQLVVAPFTPRLDWVSLPRLGSSLQDLLWEGVHRFAMGDTGVHATIQPYCYLDSLPDSHGDKSQEHILYQHTIGAIGPLKDDAGATALTQFYFFARADPNLLGHPPFDADRLVGPVTHSPSQDLIPQTLTVGHKTQWRVDFRSPGALSIPRVPAVLDSVQTLRWDVATALRVITLDVEYGDGVVNLHGAEDDQWHPDDKTAALETLTQYGRTVYRDRNDQRWDVKVRQVLSGHETLLDGGIWGKKVRKQLQLSILGPAPVPVAMPL